MKHLTGPVFNVWKLALLVVATITLSALCVRGQDAELERMTATYGQEVAKATKPVTDRYVAALTRMKELRTREGKMEQALAVDAEIKRVTGNVVDSRPAVSAEKMKERIVGVWIVSETLVNGEQASRVFQIHPSGGGSIDNREGFTWEVLANKKVILRSATDKRAEAKLYFDAELENFQGTHWNHDHKITGTRRK